MVNTATGEVFPANETSATSCRRPGEALFPGWTVPVGLQQLPLAVDRPALRSAFLPITIWTFFFAIVTTFLNFSLGLMLALDPERAADAAARASTGSC